MEMKKYLLFAGSFIIVYIVLQIVSGLLLTAFYTPEIPSEAVNSPSQVEFGNSNSIPLIISVVSLGIAFAVNRLFSKCQKS
jgi:quinol-cytochrome oxidoreductase complex cytochrome b subunit